MRFRDLVLVAFLPIAACESTAAPQASPPATPPPTTPAPAPTPAASTAATGTSCLMTHICGCNLGCARVPVDAAALREGAHVAAQTGPYAGKDMIVMKEPDATGASVFALSDREHSHACERPTPEAKSLMGFACAAKDSGPVPARACAGGCD